MKDDEKIKIVDGTSSDLFPKGVAETDVQDGVIIFPRGLQGETLVYPSSAQTMRKLLKQANLNGNLVKSGNAQFREEFDDSWYGPTFFVGLNTFIQNPAVFNITCGVVANFLTEIWKGVSGSKTAKVEFITETKNGQYSRMSYNGPVEGLNEFAEMVKAHVQKRR